MALPRHRVKHARVLDLCQCILDVAPVSEGPGRVFPGDDLFTPLERRRGLPITRQSWQNVYVNPLGHFVEERLGFRAYLRCVDDFLLLGYERPVV